MSSDNKLNIDHQPKNSRANILNGIIDFVLLYMLIAVSGIPYFEWHKEFVVIATAFAGFIFFIRGIKPHPAIIYAIILCYFIELFQGVYFNNFVIKTIFGTVCKLLLAYFTVHILNKRFFGLYINFIYISCLLSLPFFLGCYVPGFVDYMLSTVCKFFEPPFAVTETVDLYTRSDNIIIYTFNSNVIYDEIRNSGPFWEPGGFAVFINVALGFNIALEKKLFSVKNTVMIITLITTFSTGGYIAFAFLVLGHVISTPTLKYKPAILLFVIIVIPYMYTSLDFMEKKINSNLSSYNHDTTSRFGSAYFDLIDFSKNPFIGYGRRVENIYGNIAYDLRMHRNVGITSLLVHYGFFIFLIYFFYTIHFFIEHCKLTNQNKWYSLFAFFSLLASYSSQKLCELPFFISLVFMGALYYHIPKAIQALPKTAAYRL